MNTADKHYRFINNSTGCVIFYYSLSSALSDDDVKAELEKIKTQVAIINGIYQNTIYWEEIKGDDSFNSSGSL